MLGPDFPFPYDEYLAHPAGLGVVPHEALGAEVAIVGAGLAGMVAAHELLRLGLRPVVYEPGGIGGRLRSATWPELPGLVADLGGMRFPTSATTLFNYIRGLELRTRPFPNPLTPCAGSTVLDIGGDRTYVLGEADLPSRYREVADAWCHALSEARVDELRDLIAGRDLPGIRKTWHELVPEYDDQSFFGFLRESPSFARFSLRELFGQVGFGTGGWDTDYANSALEVLRVVATAADEDHVQIVGGAEQLPRGLWSAPPRSARCWPSGTAVRDLHVGQRTYPAVSEISRDGTDFVVTDATGKVRRHQAVVVTVHNAVLLTQIRCARSLLQEQVWRALRRSHYMGSTKLFVPVDRPFWRDKDAAGRDVMSMTLTDRLTRSTYLFDEGLDRPALLCLSYTWADDSLRWLPLVGEERLNLALDVLAETYPDVDIRAHVIGPLATVTWEAEQGFMGAFKANLPGQYRDQRVLFTQFMQDQGPETARGLFLAGDDISWTGGWAEGAVQTALNAVWGVLHHLGGASHPDNPGPGDVYRDIAPYAFPDDRETVSTSHDERECAIKSTEVAQRVPAPRGLHASASVRSPEGDGSRDKPAPSLHSLPDPKPLPHSRRR